MSENLIYGTDLLSYGAVGDAKTDCSVALNKAISDGQSLISIPYGNYIFKSGLNFSSNVKLSVHPKATLTFDFDSKNDCACVSNVGAQSVCSGIIITGGIWVNKTKSDLFCFDNVKNLTLSGLEILSQSNESCICLNGVSSFKLKDIYATAQKSDSFIKLCNDCFDGIIKNVKASGFDKALSFGHKNTESTVLHDIYAHALCFDNCKTLINFDKSCEKVFRVCISDVKGSFFDNALCVLCPANDIEISDINVYSLSKSKNDACYILTDSECEYLEIQNFTRDSLCESTPPIPTAIMKNSGPDCSVIIDGLALDSVIMSKGLSKDVSMTAAKLSSPHSKYTYTIELDLKSNQTFTLSNTDFETLSIS